MDKKGAELTMNVIIVAAIALLVLIILAVLVFNSVTKTQKNTGCEALGGKCISDVDCTATQETSGGLWSHDYGDDGARGNCGADQICCKQVTT
jgi:hypothetical protein